MTSTSENVIAIDGPAASGKSTIARRVAAERGYLYVDSGSLYRAVTWQALQDGVPSDDAGQVVRSMQGCDMQFFVADGGVKFRIDGRELPDEIRTEAVNSHVSPVATVPAVRRQVVAWLREMTVFGGLVMEGRDIGTAVFPGAAYKFYLDASAEERARRRHGETDGSAAVAVVGESLRRRDTIDSSRKADPLRIADDADVIDSTDMSIDDVVRYIVRKIHAKRIGRHPFVD